jgi:ATP-binding cassette subfamily F protein 3
MLRFDNIHLRRGSRLLLNGASFLVHPGWRVGLTGRNGSGKSSLLALMGGELGADGGDFSRPRDWTLAHVRQQAEAVGHSALDHALDGDVEFRALERELAEAESAHDAARQAVLHERIHAIGGYAARARAGELLHGLGFGPGDELRPVSEFSGGWRMRLNLAQALMCRSDLLLLDEPTNHLDLDAVLWLEEWLRRYSGTLIVVSHDREFLDHVVTHVLHIADANAELFAGSVSLFERKRAERMAQQQVAHERQQIERARLQRFVDRFKAQATKARQAQSRVKALERMTDIAAVRVESGIEFEFAAPLALPDPLLTLDEATLGYGERRVVDRVRLSLRPGDRIGLLGANGAGKSTLIKTLSGVHVPDKGTLAVDGEPVVFGSPRDALDAGVATVYQDLAIMPLMSVTRNFFLGNEPTVGAGPLKRFDMPKAAGIAYEEMKRIGIDLRDTDQAVGTLSGGERQTLAIARAEYFGARVLILDEPTSALGVKQSAFVLRHIIAARNRGLGVIFITHNVAHALPIGDTFTILSRGRISGTFRRGEINAEQLHSEMGGGDELNELSRELAALAATERTPPVSH